MLAMLAGCVRPGAVECSDGTICADGLRCDIDNHRCLTPEQERGCRDLQEGDLCRADGRDNRCDRGACVPSCGDGVLDEGEQCDDGDFANHDGCSSVCRAEALAWQEWESPWVPRARHAAAYDSMRGRLVVFGGSNTQPLGDTWERVQLPAGTNWRRVVTPTAPSPRRTTMAYDPVRHVVVLFGGSRDNMFLDDTWEYDGTTWTLRSQAAAPSPRSNHVMAFDPSRNQIVLTGGSDATTVFGDTWVYDGTWTPLPSAAAPAVAGAALAYDPNRQKLVLFGGGSGAGLTNDTYELGPTSWVKMTFPSRGPAKRSGAALAYFADAGGLVLYGGLGNDGRLSDTWGYTGFDWTPRNLEFQPPGASGHSLTAVRDGTTNRLVLVGGITDFGESADIYEFTNGVRWTRVPTVASPLVANKSCTVDAGGGLTVLADDNAMWRFANREWGVVGAPATSPPIRSLYALASHDARSEVVLFGGVNATLLGDTWVFDGNIFTQRTSAPPPRFGASMAYDAALQAVVMVGGTSDVAQTQLLSDTWQWSETWTQSTSATTPGPQLGAPMAYDPGAQHTVLLANDGTTWAYDGAWTKLSVPRLDPPRTRAPLAYNPLRQRLMLFGGRNGPTISNELLELTDEGWTPVLTAGTSPSERVDACLGYLPGTKELVLFGGSRGTTTLLDTWQLVYRSETPDEVCDDALDNDGDGRIDASDPDCE